MSITAENFTAIKLYTLQNEQGTTVKITNFGAIITSIITADRDGNFADIALGHNSLDEYLTAVDKPYFGAIAGPYANRIAKGQFTLNGKTYQLATNNGENHLHGGNIGLDKVIWSATELKGEEFSGLQLKYTSKDGEENYPGEVKFTLEYKLWDNNDLEITYHATSDQDTPITLTNHSYFNLKGEGNGDVLDHLVYINADHYTPTDSTAIPTGEIAPVANTPFDFTNEKTIAPVISASHQQIEYGNGFDHNFVLNKNDDEKMSLAASVYESSSGRFMEVFTEEPGIQFYTGNYLDGRLKSKAGKNYIQRGGLCLETQHFPDSPNQENFPSTILKAGDVYSSKTIYSFSTK
ncbi:galactose mutarotase [Lentisphaera marina]|uniref:aldose epimerase family protein n=1 Tax=Lentisphaera marina TaxID=1111041 RepID=UPI0023653B8D|nr:aldose epimerase family protein [Lentisphaera marina]MDD7983473.1 galactose mutarotase [Lentisphaera marina]